MMDDSGNKQGATYRRFVEAGIRNIDAAFIDSRQRSRFCIGSEMCRERINDLYGGLVEGHATKEDVSFRRGGGFYPVENILSVALEVLNADAASLKRRSMNSMIRPVVAYALCRYGGLTQRQVAEVMGIRSGAAVSLQIKRLHEQMESNGRLKAMLKSLKNRLDNHKPRNLVLKG